MKSLTSKDELRFLEELAIKSLMNAYRNHLSLGISGTKLVKKKTEGQFTGDMALVADIEAEKVVMDTFQEVKLPVRLNSEEHGLVDLNDDPKYFAVLDGLDGTGKYKAFMEGGKNVRYGTMLAIFSNTDPKYDDYLICAILDYPTSKLFISTKGNGAYVLNLKKNSRYALKSSEYRNFDANTRTIIDTYPGTAHLSFNMKTFVNNLPEGFKHIIPQTSEASYADLTCGKVDLVLECTRKGNLEIAVSYGLLKEAGGAMVSLDGKSLGKNKYLTFGQHNYLGIISAATKELALKASGFFSRNEIKK